MSPAQRSALRRGAALAGVVSGAAIIAPIAGVLALALVVDADPARPTPRPGRAGPPPAPAIAFSVPAPTPLADAPPGALWATVRRAAVARSGPSPDARALARVDARTPEGTAHLLPVLGRARDGEGRTWTRVRLPALPNGRTGWVFRGALGGYGLARTWLLVDLRRLRATLLRDGRPVFRAPVGVGRPRWPTPRGHFLVRNELTRYRSPFYGPVAFGTSARSAALTEWPSGGFVGIHGTDRPELIPGRVSHGCIRLRNPDIRRLARLMGPGTAVTIR